ncbi:phospholipase D-like domain-containing protein [Vibrio kanaloae]|uniref:phospholipase D-like domain-containing protein n=1 Tax=Vibrio kanaloae TaxID=170673 RepID=UPI00148E612A|nr:phospholipase D-like domain-containing protein [Vibrio kanaloae]
MEISYIAQPAKQLGVVIADILDSEPIPNRAYFVSAFVSLQTLIRLKYQVLNLKRQGSKVRFIVGIDLGGTSQEVLRELLRWDIDVRIVKHRIPRHTFHPKLYVFEWANQARIIQGSNNMTDGGFFGNYEGATDITYFLPADEIPLSKAYKELEGFLNPTGSTSYQLTPNFLEKMIEEGAVPSEAEARAIRGAGRKAPRKKNDGEEPLFGVEEITPPPPLPKELLEGLVKNIRARRRSTSAKRQDEPEKINAEKLTISEPGEGVEEVAAFYMTLPKLQGENIPGEGRIPLAALELANEFWGWQNEYTRDVSPRAGNDRVYWNWRPNWKIWSVDDPDNVTIQPVRMYLYENSNDFRFYVRPLVNAGGDTGDVVRITRMVEAEFEFECVLAKQGTPEYERWIKACTQKVPNSERRFGYS